MPAKKPVKKTVKKVDPPKLDPIVIEEEEPIVIPPAAKPIKKAEPKVDVVKIFTENYERTKKEYARVEADRHMDFKQQQLSLAKLDGMITVFKMVLGNV